MSTAVKNEYAVDHTDGLPGLPSWQTFKDKILPKGSKDRFEWMRDEHAAHIKSLHEQYGKQIKEKEETIALAYSLFKFTRVCVISVHDRGRARTAERMEEWLVNASTVILTYRAVMGC
jgi:hypothetical protein